MMRLIVIAVICCVSAGNVLAASKNSVIKSCIEAIEAGDKSEIQKYASKIATWKNLFSDELKIKGAQCLEAANGEPFIYDASKNAFVGGDAVSSAISPQQARQIEQEFNDAKQQLNNAIENLAVLNDELVQNEIYMACSSEYAIKPTQVMLNEICIKSFKINGHPKLAEAVNDDGRYLAAKENYNRVLLKTLGIR